MAGLIPISGANGGGGGFAVMTDGLKTHAGGGYAIWYAEDTPDLVYDLGALYEIDTLNVTYYSPSFDPRQSQFKIYVSKDNETWTTVKDYSANTTPQPVTGFDFPVPAG